MAAPSQSMIALLFLLLVMSEVEVSQGQKKDDCKRLDKLNYCQNNSQLLVTKTKNDYILRLCLGSQCMSDIPGNSNLIIKCKDVCDVCKSLPGQNDCAKHDNCEEEVDKFLDNYCVSASVGQPRSIDVIVGAGAATGAPKVASGQFLSSVQSETKTSTSRGGIAALAVLFSLCSVLLAVVTAGWVWTCWTTKKRRMPAVVNNDKTTNNSEGDGVEIYLKNPTYEGNSNQSGHDVHPVSYDTVEHSSQTVVEDGETYAVPDKNWQAKGTYMF